VITMSVELRPFGVTCNIQCQYCYQTPQRDAENLPKSYDLAKMKAAIEREGGGFTMFGGEPLLVPEHDLRELWAWGLARYGRNGIQTNGALINDNHIRMFKEFAVHVGISIDGPGELNDVRWAGSLESTREATRKTEEAIAKLCAEGRPPSLIITLHRGNATPDKLPAMRDWLLRLDELGVPAARVHLLEVESPAVREKYALTAGENLEALLSFYALTPEFRQLKLDLFDEMRNNLLGTDGRTSCVWHACDPYTTKAVRGVEGQGQSSNCGRTNKDGIDFLKAGAEGFERYLALYHTPQEAGGCRGCRFFLMCKGQCPGTSIDGDWRNRSEHCEVWMGLYRILEHELIADGLLPLSLHPDRQRIELTMLDAWAHGQNLPIEQAKGGPRT
jgi:uncharacterized protein